MRLFRARLTPTPLPPQVEHAILTATLAKVEPHATGAERVAAEGRGRGGRGRGRGIGRGRAAG